MNKSEYNEAQDTKMGRPHVIILGAGASVAAFPNGDRNRKQLPLMNNLVTVCGLDNILEKAGVKYNGGNFEDIYSDLFRKNQHEVLYDLESAVFRYFYSLKLPDYPTLYDYLAISLRPKDIIATFNWDPLLWQALERNHNWVAGPYACYLHGNTAIGYCLEDKTYGRRGGKCTKCGRTYENSKLLYPIKEKNYEQNLFIKSAWEALKGSLRNAYILTFFGYRAPKSDVEAIRLLVEGWGDKWQRELEQTEIIDIRERQELEKTWDSFIHTHHYEIHLRFKDSIIARHPRRSCEATWAKLMEIEYPDDCPIPNTSDWSELREWFTERINYENENS